MFIRKLGEKLLYVFFKNLEVVGKENIPADGPIIFVLNHPNGLLDPIFLFTLTKRPISFLAKSTLFNTPIIGSMIKSTNSIPIYRSSDAKDLMHRNHEMFAHAQRILLKGGALGLFPEGTSHSDTKIRPLKTGAARIALGAKVPELKIIPAHLYYSAKTQFRSGAFLSVGKPIVVNNTTHGIATEPDKNQVQELTQTIQRELEALALQTEHQHVLTITKIATRFFNDTGTLEEEYNLSKVILEKYSRLKVVRPDALAEIEEQLLNLNATLTQLKLTPHSVIFAPTFSKSSLIKLVITNLFFIFLGFPFALIGIILHFWPYYLNDYLSTRYCKPEDLDLIASYKLVGGLFIFLSAYLIHAFLLCLLLSPLFGFLFIVIQPFLGLFSIRYIENILNGLFKIKSVLFLTSKDILSQELRNDLVTLKTQMTELSNIV